MSGSPKTKLEKKYLEKLVVQCYLNEKSVAATKQRLAGALPLHPKSIARIIRRFLSSGREMAKMGRPVTVSTPDTVSAVQQLYSQEPSTSLSEGARRLDIKETTLRRIKKSLKIVARRKQKAPRYVKDQAERAKKNCRYIAETLLGPRGAKVLLMDDECWVPLDPQDVPGLQFFNQVPGVELAPEQRVTAKTKFFKKIMVWQCIAEGGKVSDTFFVDGTLKADRYLEECIKKRLLPFIDANFKRSEVLFWPDLARIHYAHKVTDFLIAEGIPFVPFKKNAPNVPQARPIELYWAHCKAAYRRTTTTPQDLDAFKAQWEAVSGAVAKRSGAALMSNVRAKIRAIGRRGVYALLDK